MKALLWFPHVLCFVCYCWAVPHMSRQNLNSSSMTWNLLPTNSYIDIPWLASMPGNCQGIVLTPWLILSTANCLKKLKPLYLDISGVNDPESIPHGQRICLHPKFNFKDVNNPMKADIGLIIFEEPIYGDEIPLAQSANISLKSCSKCKYESCYVYVYQSSKKLGTSRIKKIDVQLLDFSTCHHQHSNLEKTVGLCIQSQPRQDCWIQRSSPVLCLLKNRWELVGLIHKTSRICQNPTIIIRTRPYLSWIKQFIKASKKLLNPTSSLHCRTLYESDHVPQIRHSYNYIPTLASHDSLLSVSQGNLDISPQTKYTNNVPTIFNFSDISYFADSHRLFLGKSQTLQPVNSLPIAGLLESSEQNLIPYYQNIPPHNTGNLNKSPLSQVISDTTISYISPKNDGANPWGFAPYNTDESFDKIMTDIIKQSSPSEDNGMEPLNFHEESMTDDSWMENVTDLDKYGNLFRAMSNEPQNQYTTEAHLPVNFPFSEGEVAWGFPASGEAVKKTDLPMDFLLQNEMFNMPPFESRRIPKPSGTIELWPSPSDFYVVNSQDQPVTDAVRAQNHPISDVNRFQILPMESIGMPSTPNFTRESLPTHLEAKTSQYPD
ncbi:uncharacterized protein LOC116087358 [Mastomys coucha]|uniref:uncharacterized protein LOC116087358 n=1 Tax=Mastomys coucha TaxID=35658 RepID=UPI0012619EE6|nr:uncharacterized protein LOC116087358 [Mastomys coucha]